MNEFVFEPSSVQVRAGETVAFNVTNVGVVDHEFRVSNQPRIDEHIAEGVHDHGDGSEGGYYADGDFIILVPPGETGQLIATFAEDETIYTTIVCLLPGHYEAGMFGPIGYAPTD